MAWVIWPYSRCPICPLSRRKLSILASDASMRMNSCSLDISRLNTPATPNRLAPGIGWVATCWQTLSTRLVFPIDGRAATITRSPGWKPRVSRSRSGRCVPTPVTNDWCSNSFSIFGKLSCTSWRIGTKPALIRSSATEKIAPSASSRIRSASWSAS